MAGLQNSPVAVDLEMGFQQAAGPTTNQTHSDEIGVQRLSLPESRNLPLLPHLPEPVCESALMMKLKYSLPANNLDLGWLPECLSSISDSDPQILFWRLRNYNLISIQRELIDIHNELAQSKEISVETRGRMHTLLHQQAQASRDFAYLRDSFQKCADDYIWKVLMDILFRYTAKPKKTRPYRNLFWEMIPKTSLSSRLRTFLSSHLPTIVTWRQKEKIERPVDYELNHEPQDTSLTVELLANAIIALCSATIIILPIIIMTFDRSQTKSLATLSISVILFSMLLTAIFRAKNTEVFAAVATYAAVLVVFVGTSGTTGS